MRYRREQSLIMTKVRDEWIVANISTGKCFAFNPTASAIWDCLAEPCSDDEITRALLLRFEVDEPGCRRSVGATLASMLAQGLIQSLQSEAP
jgi:hypothetical protein